MMEGDTQRCSRYKIGCAKYMMYVIGKTVIDASADKVFMKHDKLLEHNPFIGRGEGSMNLTKRITVLEQE